MLLPGVDPLCQRSCRLNRIGTFGGALIGYAGGLADTLFRRLVDLLITIPFLVLVIAIVAVLGSGLLNMYIAVSAVAWVSMRR